MEEQQEQQVTVKSTSIKWGVIYGLVSIIFFVILDFAGQAGNQSLSWIGLVLFAIFVYLAHKDFKDNADGFMSYKEGLGIGTLIAVISSVISSIFTFIYVKWVSPGFIDIIREQAVIDMEERGMSDAQIEQAMGMTEKFTSPIAMLIMGIIFGIFFGFLVSLIVSAITKKNRPELA